ncbi:MAG: helicase C-terminal domain-containing protein, partial [Bacillota bacterium]|nr:helicase C-terminal domain-containing protein [Bacillota bacterium]
GETKIEDLPPGEDDYKIDLNELKESLTSEDGLQKYVESYCPRDAQMQMALKTGEAFNEAAFLLAEAGTGTGKTIAYLLPSALMAFHGNNKVVISTHTIHLQDQIINKDIPDINNLFADELRATLVKGRNHYLCYRKWHNAYNEDDMENPLFMATLLPWVAETADGDVDVLNLNAMERREWQKFSAVSDTCLRSRCPYFRGKCFVYKVRKKAENSHLIVINHSLLLTDAMADSGVLPHFDYLIIDEAHQLEKVAEDNLGYTITFFDHGNLMADAKKFLLQMEKLSAFPGLFHNNISEEEAAERLDLVENILSIFDDNAIKGDNMFKALKDCYSYFHENQSSLSRSWRIDRNARQQKNWQETEALIENYLIWINDLSGAVRKTLANFENELNDESNEKERYKAQEIDCKLGEFSTALYYFVHGEAEDMVAWLEQGNERVIYPIMRLAPIDPGSALAERLYNNKESIVFVSATLSVSNQFKYFKNNAGLNLVDRKCHELLLPSPFDYDNQCMLVAIKDTPNVGEVSTYEYLRCLSEAIMKMVTASQGRALVLFTSHSHLREVFNAIEKPLAEIGIEVLGHDISGGRNIILEKLRENKKTVVLGANSFWEGIDISGENLSLLIIVKLPFWPPDMPVLAAKMERLTDAGKNNFADLSLPQAIIRFKQGFGRLLRKEDDRGIVCVLDRRIYEKRYGAQFINSLPVNKFYKATVEEITEIIAENL